jgi:CBS domain-containing protein
LEASGTLVGFVSLTDLARRRYEQGDTAEIDTTRARRPGDEALRAGFHPEPLAEATVQDIMMPIVITLEESAPIALAAALMAAEGVHRVPIVGTGGTVVGIVSALDVLRWLAHQDGYRLPGDAAGAPA